jgi:hypothetical protein
VEVDVGVVVGMEVLLLLVVVVVAVVMESVGEVAVSVGTVRENTGVFDLVENKGIEAVKDNEKMRNKVQ